MSTPYRILSLDGGGTWALLQAMALSELYGPETKGHSILRNFDLVAATSGGSLTLAGLVADMSPGHLVHYFLDSQQRQRVFVKQSILRPRGSSFWRIAVNKLARRALGIGPIYDASSKLNGIGSLLGDNWRTVRMSELPSRIGTNESKRPIHFLICAFDYDSCRAAFFRSNISSRTQATPIAGNPNQQALDRLLAEAVHASTNAPVNYFDAPARVGSRRYWDGAMGGLNNPLLAALTEALANWPDHDPSGSPPVIHALSLGTGRVTKLSEREIGRLEASGIRALIRHKLIEPIGRVTLKGDVKRAATCILDDPPDSATFIAHVMLRQALSGSAQELDAKQPGPIVRMSPLVRPVWNAKHSHIWLPPQLKDLNVWQRCQDLTMDAIASSDVRLIEAIGRAWIRGEIENQAIRGEWKLGSEGRPIGHRTFADAMRAWQILAQA